MEKSKEYIFPPLGVRGQNDSTSKEVSTSDLKCQGARSLRPARTSLCKTVEENLGNTQISKVCLTL